jgi:hypothetical protein
MLGCRGKTSATTVFTMVESLEYTGDTVRRKIRWIAKLKILHPHFFVSSNTGLKDTLLCLLLRT